MRIYGALTDLKSDGDSRVLSRANGSVATVRARKARSACSKSSCIESMKTGTLLPGLSIRETAPT